ncbi:hypothetical protein P7C70_g1359, partial [Phenoliferia sp. Uapishka_3]
MKAYYALLLASSFSAALPTSGTSDALTLSTTAASALGALPYAATSAYTTPSPTSIGLQPTPTLSGKAEVAALWASVEAQIPVQTAGITETVSVPVNYSFGSDPPSYYRRPDTVSLKFPKGFLYGVASAATQVEGAAKADGRGPSSWDYLCHTYPSQCNGFAPDVTTNNYYLYPLDLARISHMGANALSFSISWTRIYPLGAGEINEPGLTFYDDVIDETIKNGITPLVTLFHWDTPYALLQKYGAFEDTGAQIVEDFVAYAETVFRRYPGGINVTSAPYQCTYNILKAHGKVVSLYRELVASGDIASGVIGLKNDDNYPVPARPGTDDEESAERHGDFRIGIFAQPIYGDGDYPTSVKDTLGTMLPALSADDKELIKGSADFFALDGYRTDISRAALNGIATCAKNLSDPNWPVCEESANAYAHSYPDGWAIGQSADPLSSWLVNSAPFIRGQLKNLVARFPAKEGIYFSEFGWAEPFEYLRTELYQITWDGLRTQYIRGRFSDYLNELLLAIHVDKIDLRGAFAWSYIDNFEWGLGLEEHFGMQYVNHSDPALPRSYKLSAFEFRDFGRAHLQD